MRIHTGFLGEIAMTGTFKKALVAVGLAAGLTGALGASSAIAANVTFNLTANSGLISTPDGGQLHMWSFTDNGTFRYPGPTLDVNVGDVVTINVINNLPDNSGQGADAVSILFPGQSDVLASVDGGAFAPVMPTYTTAGLKKSLRSLTADLPSGPGHTLSYRFTATNAGTYQYHSGTQVDKQVDMGLYGALIVRPNVANQAYLSADSAYDVEYIQILSAIDPTQHSRVERGLPYQGSAYRAEYWFINGRSFPDTVSDPNVAYIPNQPMDSLVAMYPGERVLLRVIAMDRDLHPYHHHGNHATVIAENGRLMSSQPDGIGVVADLARDRFTQAMSPGHTVDAIFTWDAAAQPNFGFDITGTVDNVPVVVPPVVDNPNIYLNYGETYSGSPYLGKKGLLPNDVTAININQHGEMYFPLHSHHEQELQNQNEGPGGMLTLIMICQTGQLCPNHP